MVSDLNVVRLTDRRIGKHEQQAVTSDEGWRLIRAFRQIADAKRRAEIIALVQKDPCRLHLIGQLLANTTIASSSRGRRVNRRGR